MPEFLESESNLSSVSKPVEPSITSFSEPHDAQFFQHVLDMIYSHWKTQLALIQSSNVDNTELQQRVDALIKDIRDMLTKNQLNQPITVLVQHGEHMVPVMINPLSVRAEFDEQHRPYLKIDVVRKLDGPNMSTQLS